MNIFNPFKIIEETDSHIHLELSARNKLLNILSFRLLPVLIMFLIGCFFYLNDHQLPVTVYIGFFIIFFVIVLMLFTKIIVEVHITGNEIRIFSFRAMNTREQTYLLKDISHIHLTIYTGGRSRGAYYKLILKDKHKVILFNLPIFFGFNKNKFILVNQKITNLTSLPIEGHLDKLKE